MRKEKKKDITQKNNFKEFKAAIQPLIKSEAVQQMKKFPHHGATSCYRHSMHVSFYNFLLCKLLHLDAKAGARAGLLHDLFLYDWHEHKPQLGELPHGFTHPTTALRNANKRFKLSEKEQDMIKKHMFPLTIGLPKYKETWVIVMVDKFCSTIETLEGFVMPYLLYKKIKTEVFRKK